MLPRAGLPASLVAHLVTPITLRKMFVGRFSPCRPLGTSGKPAEQDFDQLRGSGSLLRQKLGDPELVDVVMSGRLPFVFFELLGARETVEISGHCAPASRGNRDGTESSLTLLLEGTGFELPVRGRGQSLLPPKARDGSACPLSFRTARRPASKRRGPDRRGRSPRRRRTAPNFAWSGKENGNAVRGDRARRSPPWCTATVCAGGPWFLRNLALRRHQPICPGEHFPGHRPKAHRETRPTA